MSVTIVAEIGASHDGDIKTALKLIQEAAKAGANAVKLQTFDPKRMVGDKKYIIDSGPWEGRNLLNLYQQAHTPREWHKELFDFGVECGIEIFSTPFHPDDVDFLEGLNCPRYKISSFDIINLPLIEYAASTGKPLIISTGMCSTGEMIHVKERVNLLTLMHCVSKYPADHKDMELSYMDELRKYANNVGLSDHTYGYLVPILAVAKGVSIIEKHIKLSNFGLDSGFAMFPCDFKIMVDKVRLASLIINNTSTLIGPDESDSHKLRPSLYYTKNLKAGTTLKKEHFQIARPNKGAHPNLLNDFIGKTLNIDVNEDDPVENHETTLG